MNWNRNLILGYVAIFLAFFMVVLYAAETDRATRESYETRADNETSVTDEIATTFEQPEEEYLIKDNKLYYNVNCNGKVEMVFITDVDEYNEDFWVSGYAYESRNAGYFPYSKRFPIVMVSGETKFFLLRSVQKTEERNNFYAVQEIIIEEVSFEERKIFATQSNIMVEQGNFIKYYKIVIFPINVYH